ncbi:MAG: hypothetical protein RMK29_15650 [Myxococcales bacterium]|nr:hypothetical protein [Myxococcota bacterium]MDW8283150.1 hypothetical protein [Myxococcales bacterium]
MAEREGRIVRSGSLFERTWETAIALCRRGEVRGRAFVAGTVPDTKRGGGARRWAVVDHSGATVFMPAEEEQEQAMALFLVARRFSELEEAYERGVPPQPYVAEPRRTYLDSLREWGLLDEEGNVLKAYDPDPEPLLGYVVRVGQIYAYGVVKQSTLSTGSIIPTGACESAEEARRRASELLMLALVRGATVMGMNGIPAVIDLSAEPDEEAMP